MVNDLFDGTKGFAIDGGIKDSTHIRKLAADTNSPMPALVRVPRCVTGHCYIDVVIRIPLISTFSLLVRCTRPNVLMEKKSLKL